MKQLSIIGHIGQDATIKEVNGNHFVDFSVAVNERYKKNDGTEVESTQWFSCSTKNLKLAEFLKKGTQVMAQGSFNVNLYQDKNRQYQTGINLHASLIQLLSAPKEESKEPEIITELRGIVDRASELINQHTKN
jgi:single-strand DNA-binding protein